MPRPKRDLRGFTGVEILIVLAVIGVLAGAGYAAAGHYRARAAEAEMRQDLVHFVNQQQVYRQRTGGLGTLLEVEEMGYRRSPGVVVEHDWLDGDGRRAYLRVRHEKTGQRCSVDYSPYVSNALNRVQCWAGPDDPTGSERLAGGDPPPAPGGGTAPVDTARADTTTISDPVCAAASAPTLTSPTDQTLRPGLAGTGVYTLTNPGSGARSYSLSFSSSNPTVIATPTGPGSVTVPARGSRTVTASYQMESRAQAGQMALLPLEAADDECPTLAANGFFSVATELVLGPIELVDLPDLVARPGDTIRTSWSTMSHTNAPRMMVLAPREDPGLMRAPSAAVGKHQYATGVSRMVPLKYVLHPDMDGFERRQACMEFYDDEAGSDPALRRQECFTVTAEFIPRAPGISAPATREAGQEEEFTSRWTVVNNSNADRDFSVVPDFTSDLRVVRSSGTGSLVRIRRGETHVVDVTYRVLRPSLAGTESRGTLTVADIDPRYASVSTNTAAFAVRTKLEVCAPTIVAAPGDRTESPGTAFTATWRLRNCTNAPRELALAPAGDVDVLTAGAARTESFGFLEERVVALPYRMKDRSVHRTQSRPTMQASDAGLGAQSAFTVTTDLVLCAPTMQGPAGVPAQPQDPNTWTSVGYTVENCSNAERTFAVPVASSNVAAVYDPADPANVAIPAYGSRAVSFTYGIPANAFGGVPADLMVRVQDTEAGALAALGGFRVTPRVIRAAPLLSTFPAQTILPGQSASATATLTSQSNVPVRYCFTTAVSAGTAPADSVVPRSPAAPPCVEISTPYGTAPVPQTVSVQPAAEHPWTNHVTVTAVDQDEPTLRSVAPFTVTADLLLANPTLRVPRPPVVVRWQTGKSQRINYLVGNQSNATRTLCVTVSASAPESLVSAFKSPICATLGARQSHTFVDSLTASMEPIDEVTIHVRAYDSVDTSYAAVGSYLGEVKSQKPVARWTAPNAVYVRRWFEVDGMDSYSVSGSPLVKYIWSWGLPGMHWDGARFVSGGSGSAADSSDSPRMRRAYDTKGAFPVCLIVVDAEGNRSDANCQDVTTLVMTRARLKWRYRGWWYKSSDFCWDVPWDNQCPKESGNARWEVLLDASEGDVPIRRAWATFRIGYWQTDDKFERDYSYAGNSDPMPRYAYAWGGGTKTYDFLSNDQKASSNVQSGVWRVLDTNGSGAGGWPQAPNLTQHRLVLNANLGSATGMFDGGPHWVPDDAWVTLYVEDDRGAITSQSGYYDHKRADWRGSDCINGTSGFFTCMPGFERLLPPPSAPTGSIHAEEVDGRFRLTGSGESVDGRVVDMYWEVSLQPMDFAGGPGSSYTSRSRVLELSAEPCTSQDVTLILVDDQGRVGSAHYSIPSSGRITECSGSEGPGGPTRPL
jgi:type II secretory pathway pseudopilin PulG